MTANKAEMMAEGGCPDGWEWISGWFSAWWAVVQTKPQDQSGWLDDGMAEWRDGWVVLSTLFGPGSRQLQRLDLRPSSSPFFFSFSFMF